MGWSYGTIHCTPKEELRRLVEGPAHFAEKPSRYRLLDCAIVRFRVAYLACLDLNDGKIRALVFRGDHAHARPCRQEHRGGPSRPGQ